MEQRLSQTLALMVLVHGKAGENHYRHGVASQPFACPRWRGLRFNTADRQTIEAGSNAVALAADVRLGAIRSLVHQRQALQELIERGLCAIEPINLVLGTELVNCGIARRQPVTRGSLRSFLSRGLFCTGRSSAA